MTREFQIMRWLTALTLFAATNVAAQFAVSTNPSPVHEGRPFQVSVAGIFRPNIAGDPRGPLITVSDQTISVWLRRSCGFLCPSSGFENVTFSMPSLVAGNYMLEIYQGGPEGGSRSPDVRYALTSAPLTYQGLWWNSPAGSESGWGLSIDHQGEILFAVWFTYDASGNGMWLVIPRAEKKAPGLYEGPLYRTNGPPFDSSPWRTSSVTAAALGTGTLSFSDTSNGTFVYTMNGVTQSKPITRQVFSFPVATCVATN